MCVLFAFICCFVFVFFKKKLGDALLCYEVVCKYAIENVVLVRCEVFFLVGAKRLVCRVVGLLLFVLVGILFL